MYVGFHARMFILAWIYVCKLGLFKANGLLVRESFFNHVIASFNFIVCGSNLYLASRSSLQSGNICKSILRSLFLPSLRLSPHVFLFIFLVEPRSIARSHKTSTGSSSQPSVSSKSLDVVTTRTVSLYLLHKWKYWFTQFLCVCPVTDGEFRCIIVTENPLIHSADLWR